MVPLQLRDLPLRKRLFLFGGIIVLSAVAIFWMSFILVALRKTFEAATVWETVAAFVVINLAIWVPWLWVSRGSQ
jgi:hypothetical protein